LTGRALSRREKIAHQQLRERSSGAALIVRWRALRWQGEGLDFIWDKRLLREAREGLMAYRIKTRRWG
jgi:hypothetical protein